jgi:hypothetical protein
MITVKASGSIGTVMGMLYKFPMMNLANANALWGTYGISLLWGVEIWAWDRHDGVDSLDYQWLRALFGLSKGVGVNGLRWLAGRIEPKYYRWVRAMRFYGKMMSLGEDTLEKQAFRALWYVHFHGDDRSRKHNWVSKMILALKEVGWMDREKEDLLERGTSDCVRELCGSAEDKIMLRGMVVLKEKVQGNAKLRFLLEGIDFFRNVGHRRVLNARPFKFLHYFGKVLLSQHKFEIEYLRWHGVDRE